MRVNLVYGDTPIVLVAPHGVMGDDDYTDTITELAAKHLDAYAVINFGWSRGEVVDASRGIANLNSVKHCKSKEVRKEFLEPLAFMVDNVVRSYKRAHVFYIHGMGNYVRSIVKSQIDVILGYGEGDPPSYTCDKKYKDEFAYRLKKFGLSVYQGGAGGKFSARSKDNLCQFFRQHKPDNRVNSIQIEIINGMRDSVGTAKRTAKTISQAISDFIYKNVTVPHGFVIPEI